MPLKAGFPTAESEGPRFLPWTPVGKSFLGDRRCLLDLCWWDPVSPSNPVFSFLGDARWELSVWTWWTPLPKIATPPIPVLSTLAVSHFSVLLSETPAGGVGALPGSRWSKRTSGIVWASLGVQIIFRSWISWPLRTKQHKHICNLIVQLNWFERIFHYILELNYLIESYSKYGRTYK